MGATTSTFDAVLKEFYTDKIAEELNQKSVLLDWFEKRDDMPTDGRRVVYPAHLSRNGGVGSIGEGGTLPTAGNQGYADFLVAYKYTYGRIQLTAQTIKQSQTSQGAFRKAVDEEIKRTARDVRRLRNRQMFGYGLGVLCLVNGAVSASVTVVVDNSHGQTDTVNGTRFLKNGDTIAFINPSGGAIRDKGTISTVDSGVQITMTAVVTVSDNDIICTAANGSVTATTDIGYNNEPMGLSGMLDDGTLVSTYAGLARGTYPILNAFVANLNASLTLNAVQKAFDAVDQKSNGEIKVMFAHHSVRREYLLLLNTFRRYVDRMALTPDGGFKGAAIHSDISYAEVPMKAERDCPYRKIFGLDPTFCYRYVVTEGEWADDDGRILLRVANQDSYEARYRVFDNFQNDAPNTGFLIKGITMSENEEVIQLI